MAFDFEHMELPSSGPESSGEQWTSPAFTPDLNPARPAERAPTIRQMVEAPAEAPAHAETRAQLEVIQTIEAMGSAGEFIEDLRTATIHGVDAHQQHIGAQGWNVHQMPSQRVEGVEGDDYGIAA